MKATKGSKKPSQRSDHALAGLLFNLGQSVRGFGLILTNWHVVDGYERVSITFKPPHDEPVRPSHVFDATVVRVDEVADLALVKILRPPSPIKVLTLGDMSDIDVAMDVHAIGHPLEEFWTYTKGIVSQIRKGYVWNYLNEADLISTHKATVIQTQTPINPGNSGGPLFNDNGEIIGVNSFGTPDSEGINFAVSLVDIQGILARKDSRYGESGSYDIFEWNSSAIPGDSDGNGSTDYWALDRNGNGKNETYIVDENEDGEIDYVLIDENENGQPDIKVITETDSSVQYVIWLYDTDEDGEFDVIGYDYNFDSQPDIFSRM